MTRKLTSYVILAVVLMLPAALLAANGNKLTIEGVEDELLDNINTSLSLTAEPCDAPSWRIEKLFESSEAEISRAARALGYYGVTVAKSLDFSEECWQAQFNIEPGEPVAISELDIQIRGAASEDPFFKKLLENSPVKTGTQLHHGHYETLKRDIEIFAAERGYFDGKMGETKLLIDPDQKSANVVVHYDSGKRYRIGRINIRQDAFVDKLVNKYISLQSGDFYSSSDLITQQKKLTNSSLFDNISIRPDLQNLNNELIDIDIELTPRKRTAYKVGIGASSDTGPRLVLGYERRRINRLGHRFESTATLSPKDSQITAEYIIPLTEPDRHQLGFLAGYRYLETDSSTTKTTSLGVNHLGERWGWRESIKLEWISEEYTIGDEEREGTLLIPSVIWSRTEADSQVRTTKGYRMNFELRGAHSSLLSDASFLQTAVRGKWINPFWKGRLILRGEAGATLTNSFDKIPVTYRFFAGGDQSVRGYDFESLGPTNSDGDVAGGKFLLTSSVEYEHPVAEDWGVALFLDAGNAYDDGKEGLKLGVGTGVRWQSPVGPVRIDFAVPLDNDKEDFRIHFSMGPDL